VRIYEDLRLVQSRLAVVQAVVVGLLLLLVIQFWNLQVVRVRHFRDLAENNRSRMVTLAAPRGAFLDRRGQVLVANRPSFNVLLTAEHAENAEKNKRTAKKNGTGDQKQRERVCR
jgi:penicillin-binding protein 2